MKKQNQQANSFPCKLCGEVFSEESGATENFVCENCYGDIEVNPFRRASADIIDIFDSHRGHTTKGEKYYELEDEITSYLQKYLDTNENPD